MILSKAVLLSTLLLSAHSWDNMSIKQRISYMSSKKDSVFSYFNQKTTTYYPDVTELYAFLKFLESSPKEYYSEERFDNYSNTMRIAHRLFGLQLSYSDLKMIAPLLHGNKVRDMFSSLPIELLPLTIVRLFEYVWRSASPNDKAEEAYYALLDKLFLHASNKKYNYKQTMALISSLKDPKSARHDNSIRELALDPWLYLVPVGDGSLLTYFVENLLIFGELVLASPISIFNLERHDNAITCTERLGEYLKKAPKYRSFLMSNWKDIPGNCLYGTSTSSSMEALHLYTRHEEAKLTLHQAGDLLYRKRAYQEPLKVQPEDLKASMVLFHTMARIQVTAGVNTEPKFCEYFYDTKFLDTPFQSNVLNQEEPFRNLLVATAARKCNHEKIKPLLFSGLKSPMTNTYKKQLDSVISLVFSPQCKKTEKMVEDYGPVHKLFHAYFVYHGWVKKGRSRIDQVPAKTFYAKAFINAIPSSELMSESFLPHGLLGDMFRYFGVEYAERLKRDGIITKFHGPLLSAFFVNASAEAVLVLLGGGRLLTEALWEHEGNLEVIRAYLKYHEVARSGAIDDVQDEDTSENPALKETYMWIREFAERYEESDSFLFLPFAYLNPHKNNMMGVDTYGGSLSKIEKVACLYAFDSRPTKSPSLVEHFQPMEEDKIAGKELFSRLPLHCLCINKAKQEARKLKCIPK